MGLAFFFALGVKGLGGVLSIRLRTSSSLGFLDMGGIPEFPDPTGRIYGRKPYEKIGRCIVAWGYFEQDIISQTWLSRDPLGKNPFTVGPIERGFEKRWNEWADIHRKYASDRAKFDAFFSEVKKLSNFRDNLSHNVTDVFIGEDGFSLQIHQRTADWRTKWDRWWDKYGKLPRPAQPLEKLPYSGRLFLYRDPDLEGFLADVTKARDTIKGLSEALVRAARA